MIDIAENILKRRSRISKSALEFNRSESEVTLLAVSKMQSVDAINFASKQGLKDFGEKIIYRKLSLKFLKCRENR